MGVNGWIGFNKVLSITIEPSSTKIYVMEMNSCYSWKTIIENFLDSDSNYKVVVSYCVWFSFLLIFIKLANDSLEGGLILINFKSILDYKF